MDFDVAWRVAELRWRANRLSTSLAAGTRDRERARAARELCDRLFALDPADVATAEEIVATLTDWTGPLPGPRPDEADRAVRDHVKDVLWDRSSYDTRIWVRDASLFLEVKLRHIIGRPDVGARAREDAFYLYGRASMALEIGDREAYEREWVRLTRISG